MVKAKKKVTHDHAWTAIAVARIMLGFVFLWAFLDKTMGLGFATKYGESWVNGVSPTAGRGLLARGRLGRGLGRGTGRRLALGLGRGGGRGPGQGQHRQQHEQLHGLSWPPSGHAPWLHSGRARARAEGPPAC